MAVNETRSLTADLREGLTDGSVKKDTPDRGGVSAPNNHSEHVLQEQYGVSQSYGAASDMADRLHDGRSSF